MEPFANDTPLIVIVGPTASGKTALALSLAERFGGEVVAADSRTVYKGMDIGTAKPTAEERARIPHHLIDVVEPNQRFTVADFQELARQAIADITARGKLPILVGGSGLYIDAVVYNFSFRVPPQIEERKLLEGLSAAELQARLAQRGIPLPVNNQNPRHLVRTLETGGAGSWREPLGARTVTIGLDPGREVLRQHITARVAAMVDAGFVEEVRDLADKYGWDAPALQAPGYRAFRRFIEGELSLDAASQLFIQNDMQYVKRQQTWFKRNPDIHWISKMDEAVELVTTLLNK